MLVLIHNFLCRLRESRQSFSASVLTDKHCFELTHFHAIIGWTKKETYETRAFEMTGFKRFREVCKGKFRWGQYILPSSFSNNYYKWREDIFWKRVIAVVYDIFGISFIWVASRAVATAYSKDVTLHEHSNRLVRVSVDVATTYSEDLTNHEHSHSLTRELTVSIDWSIYHIYPNAVCQSIWSVRQSNDK